MDDYTKTLLLKKIRECREILKPHWERYGKIDADKMDDAYWNDEKTDGGFGGYPKFMHEYEEFYRLDSSLDTAEEIAEDLSTDRIDKLFPETKHAKYPLL